MLTIFTILYTCVFIIILGLQYADWGKIPWYAWFFAILWPFCLVAFILLASTAFVYNMIKDG